MKDPKSKLLFLVKDLNLKGGNYIIADDSVQNNYLPALTRYGNEWQIYSDMMSPWIQYENEEHAVDAYLDRIVSETEEYVVVGEQEFTALRITALNEKIHGLDDKTTQLSKDFLPIKYIYDNYKGSYILSGTDVLYLFGISVTDEVHGFYYVYLYMDGRNISIKTENTYELKSNSYLLLKDVLPAEAYTQFLSCATNILQKYVVNDRVYLRDKIKQEFDYSNYSKLYLNALE